VGGELVKHPLLEAVGFTGSLGGGRALYDIAAARPKPIPVYAEMGSINPMVMLPDAIKSRGDALAEGFVGSVTLGAGQFCTNPGLVLVLDGPETGAFIEKVTALMDEKQPGVLLNAKIESGLQRAVASTASAGGVQTLVGAQVIEGDPYCYANSVLQTTAADFIENPDLQNEHFGPVTMFVVCDSLDEMRAAINALHGNLTSTIHAEASEQETARELYAHLQDKAGRLIWNGFPTGVEVVASMQHGGPYPATTAPGTTSVGMTAIKRFMRPVAWQNLPDDLLPDALKNANPLGIWRTVDDVFTKDAI
jgi:NADP-dependent aldehyde dehydrogenase